MSSHPKSLDTLNFALVTERNQQSDTRVSPRAPRNSRHGLRPRIITERISSDRSRSPTRIRTRPLDTSSTWYIPALSPPRAAHRDAADSIQSQCWIACHHQGLLLPHPHTADANQDRHRLPHLTRILMVQFVHIQAHHRFALLPRWFMDLKVGSEGLLRCIKRDTAHHL